MNRGEDLRALFQTWRTRIEALIREHPLQIISWEATRRCNLRCLHCGSPGEEVSSSDELSTDEVVGAFDEIARDFDMDRFRHINITGGEPFVRRDLLDVLRAISHWPFYRNIDIQTNGVFLSDNPGVLEELSSLGVTGLGISIDGFESSHDSLRGQPGTWAKATDAARLAVDAGYVVTVSFVAHSKNIHELPAFHRFAKQEIRPRVFRVMIIDKQGRAQGNSDLYPTANQVREVIGFLRQEYERSCSNYSDSSVTMVELGCGGWMGPELEGRLRPFVFHCIAGLNNLGVLFDGKLSSCSNISRSFVQGDLRRERIKDVWEGRYEPFRRAEWKKTGPCAQCEEWSFCHGGPMHKRCLSGTIDRCLYLDSRVSTCHSSAPDLVSTRRGDTIPFNLGVRQ
ncbi:MAG: radical SAM protein [Acidobacteriota bacterium]